MKVVVPYTEIAHGVLAALEKTGYTWTLRYTGDSDEAYWRLLDELWHGGESFVIVEHDVVVRRDSLAELEACGHLWCAFGVPYFVGVYPGMACVKFGLELLRRNPQAIERIAAMADATHPPKHWCRLDGWLRNLLQTSGEVQHVHGPPLEHYRIDAGTPWPTHGCVTREA